MRAVLLGSVVASAAALALALGLASCASPVFLAKDGTVEFQQQGAHGANVVTADGLELRDSVDGVPVRHVSKDANEPWRAPIGFLVPRNGVFTQTSKKTTISSKDSKEPAGSLPPLEIVLRPSDTRVPSWGGEVLVRVDVIAPAAEGEKARARNGVDVVIVVDGGEDTAALVAATLGQLAARDRVEVLDALTGQPMVPWLPASNRSLITAAVEQRLAEVRGPRALAPVLAQIKPRAGTDVSLRVVILSDGKTPVDAGAQKELERLAAVPVGVDVFASSPNADAKVLGEMGRPGGGNVVTKEPLPERVAEVQRIVPPSGDPVYQDVTLSFEGTPAPSHVLEASGGDVRWRLESGELDLGELRAGDARTEVVRVTVPAWIAGEAFAFQVTAHLADNYGMGHELSAKLPCVYDDDLGRLADSRSGDVIAYASALATRKRLDSAFLGGAIDRQGGLRKLAMTHAHSLTELAKATNDPALAEEAAALTALAAAH
jgi:hypothetical protein